MKATESRHQPTEPMPTHECPYPGCGRQVPMTLYSCAPHWRDLPVHVQRKISFGHNKQDRDLWTEGHKLALNYWRDVD